MFTLVTGGAASGKSEYAENLITTGRNPSRIYIATMELWDAECHKRAEKHQRNRAGKQFTTVECPRDLLSLSLPSGSDILLECLSNLTANECFGPQGFAEAQQRILQGIKKLRQQARHLVVVTNEIFSDGCNYPQDSQNYIACLGRLNLALASQADVVVEVVCGLPVYWKGAAV